MPTITTATLFVRQRSATTETTAEGFTLVLNLVDNQGRNRVEPYVVKWVGEDAHAWWHKHGPLPAGTALRLVLENPRSFLVGKEHTETRARVRSCDLLPTHRAASAPCPAPAAQAVAH